MDIAKSYSRTSFLGIFFVIVVLWGAVGGSFYYGMDTLFPKISISGNSGKNLAQAAEQMEQEHNLRYNIRLFFVPVSAGIFLVFGLLLWLFLKFSVNKLVTQKKSAKTTAVPDSAEKKAEEKRKKEQSDKRLFLHLLSALQREGRLVDFFSENLELYEDSQIGAAVRTIHENCKKTMSKYISLRAVIDQNEGDNVVIEPGFDPRAIKLIGNVSGEPPFTGVLRHRGWQVAKFDLPKLSDTGNIHAISPAEVEIK